MFIMQDVNNDANDQILACIDCNEEGKHILWKYYLNKIWEDVKTMWKNYEEL